MQVIFSPLGASCTAVAWWMPRVGPVAFPARAFPCRGLQDRMLGEVGETYIDSRHGHLPAVTMSLSFLICGFYARGCGVSTQESFSPQRAKWVWLVGFLKIPQTPPPEPGSRPAHSLCDPAGPSSLGLHPQLLQGVLGSPVGGRPLLSPRGPAAPLRGRTRSHVLPALDDGAICCLLGGSSLIFCGFD